MRQFITVVAGLLLTPSAPAAPNDRQFPEACIVFVTAEDSSHAACAGGLDISGTLACGHRDSDQMTEVSWRFLYAAATGDVYRVTRSIRAKDALKAEPLETKEIVYSGARLVLFTEVYTVTFQPSPKET